VLGRLGFNDSVPIEAGTPEERQGHLTFGTMNNPYKYNRATLATWAEVMRGVEGSRFLFVRPEGATAPFRDNVRKTFEANGVAGDRIDFIAVRGIHLQYYNKIDIALDTFPQTGGTTTCETLWMGVPTVSLVGEAFYERLSYSNLSNAGLGDLCAFDREGYVRTALDLARDQSRRQELRRTLRERIRDHPLGRAEWFVEDFQEAALRAVDQAKP
jgi:predicted O-linked N-acetylglucosamine transferase (SPINDLY family)